MAIQHLSLRALREQIESGTREVTFKTDDGAMTQMVYIPALPFRPESGTTGPFPCGPASGRVLHRQVPGVAQGGYRNVPRCGLGLHGAGRL